jgi:hypothetical protein
MKASKDDIALLMKETSLGPSPVTLAIEESENLDDARDLLKSFGARLTQMIVVRRRAQVEAERARRDSVSSEERPHHKESASSLQPKEWCPRYKSESSSNEAAEIGTLQHYAAETGDLSGLDDTQAEKVTVCLDFIANRVKELRAQYPDLVDIKEVYGEIDEVEWPTMNERSTSGGFVDRVLLFDDGRQAEIWDYKFGKWPVEPAENNLQGIVYLLNLRKQYPTLERARVGFLMPYLDIIDFHDFTQADFPELYVRVKRLVAKRQDPNLAEENPSFTTCMWCANIAKCKAVTNAVVKAAKKFSPLKVPKNLDPNSISASDDISAWIQFGDVCSAYGSAVRELCTQLVVEDPALVPESHDLIDQTLREVSDQSKWKAFLADKGVPSSVLERISKISLTSATKALRDLAPRGEKELFSKAAEAEAAEAGLLVPGTTKIFLRAKRPQVE